MGRNSGDGVAKNVRRQAAACGEVWLIELLYCFNSARFASVATARLQQRLMVGQLVFCRETLFGWVSN
jgi:hypothetical protein